jgi:hypothetical protein
MELTFILLYYIDISGTIRLLHPFSWNRNRLRDRASHLFTELSNWTFLPRTILINFLVWAAGNSDRSEVSSCINRPGHEVHIRGQNLCASRSVQWQPVDALLSCEICNLEVPCHQDSSEMVS